MKRHVQEPGVRKWSGDDLLELQGEPLAVLDQFFGQYGDMVIKGCEIDQEAGTVSAGLVAISGKDAEGKDAYKVCPFRGATGVKVFPCYLALKYTEFTRDYDDTVVRPIAYQYEAELLTVKPTDRPYLDLSVGGRVQFLDVIQDALHRFVSDDDRKKWDAKATAGHTHAIATEKIAGFMGVLDRKKTDKLGAIEDYAAGDTVAGKVGVLEKKMPGLIDHDPGPTDYNYYVGSEVWTVREDGSKRFWRCHDNTKDAAIWKPSGEGGGGSYGGAVYLTGQTNFSKASILIKEGYLS